MPSPEVSRGVTGADYSCSADAVSRLHAGSGIILWWLIYPKESNVLSSAVLSVCQSVLVGDNGMCDSHYNHLRELTPHVINSQICYTRLFRFFFLLSAV